MDLIIGCPVRHREWVIGKWFEYALRSCDYAEIYSPMFVLAGAEDDPTYEPFADAADKAGVRWSYVETGESGLCRDKDHVWTKPKMADMAALRNVLLDTVRDHEPEYFLSLDSDILLGEDVIYKLLHGVYDGYDAVGGKCWLSERSQQIVNYANLARSGGLDRKDQIGRFDVQVLMAIKLMTPKAYWVDYFPDDQGEDIGWSKAARSVGCRLGWDGSAVSKHIWNESFLDSIDKRVGW